MVFNLSSTRGTADPARYVKPGLASIPEEDLYEYSGNTTVCIGYIIVLMMIATATALAAMPGIPTPLPRREKSELNTEN